MTKASLIEFPDRIETPRLYIRPCMPGDGSDVFRAIADSRSELKPWLPFARKEQTLEEVEAGVRESFADFIKKTDIRLHIYLKETDEFIGSTGLHRIDWDVPKVEIGYWLNSRHTKKGYMVEAACTPFDCSKKAEGGFKIASFLSNTICISSSPTFSSVSGS